MRIGEVARKLGIHSNTVINLERRGIVKPMRDKNGHRRYLEEDVEKIKDYFFLRKGRNENAEPQR